MGKRKDSLYFQGEKTHDWKIIKYLRDDDYVVCGYIRNKHMARQTPGFRMHILSKEQL